MNTDAIRLFLISLCDAQDTVTHLNEKGPGFEKETREAIRVRNSLIDEIARRFELATEKRSTP